MADDVHEERRMLTELRLTDFQAYRTTIYGPTLGMIDYRNPRIVVEDYLQKKYGDKYAPDPNGPD